MSLRAGVAPWQRPARRSRWGRVGKLMLGLLAGLVLALYLAGYVFLWWVQADPREASPLTIVRYAYYYGYREDLRQRLAVSSAAALVLVSAVALLALLPKARSLHGSARFASRREIARALFLAGAGYAPNVPCQ